MFDNEITCEIDEKDSQTIYDRIGLNLIMFLFIFSKSDPTEKNKKNQGLGNSHESRLVKVVLFWFGGAPLVELSVDGFVLMFFVDICPNSAIGTCEVEFQVQILKNWWYLCDLGALPGDVCEALHGQFYSCYAFRQELDGFRAENQLESGPEIGSAKKSKKWSWKYCNL